MTRSCASLLCLLPALASSAVVFRKPSDVMGRLQRVQDAITEARKKDEDSKDKLSCWCQTQLSEKQSDMDNLGQLLQNLESDVASTSASVRGLDVEIDSHEKELEDNQNDLNTAVAIREKQAAKFSDEEQTMVANVGTIGQAMHALKNPGATSELQGPAESASATSAMAAMLGLTAQPWQSKASRASLLQLQGQLKSQGKSGQKQSPDVIYGVLHEMKSNFKSDLEASRKDEAANAADHEDLVGAKQKQINSLRKQLITKKQRIGDDKVAVAQKSKLAERYQGLQTSIQELRVALNGFCKDNDDSWQSRSDEYQQLLLAIANANSAYTSQQSNLLQTSGSSKNPNYADQLCTVALGVQGKEWRDKAQAACEKARNGNTQDAADDAEALQDALTAKAKNLEEQKQECESSIDEQKRGLSQAAAGNDAKAAEVSSDKEQADAQISSLKAQSTSSEKAKDELTQLSHAVHEAMHELFTTNVNNENILKKVQGLVETPAAGKVTDAMESAKKLSEAAQSFDKRCKDAEPKIAALLTAQMQASAKALVPLQMMQADAEEAEVSVNEAKEEIHAVAPTCNPAALQNEADKLKGYSDGLGNAAQAWAVAALR